MFAKYKALFDLDITFQVRADFLFVGNFKYNLKTLSSFNS